MFFEGTGPPGRAPLFPCGKRRLGLFGHVGLSRQRQLGLARRIQCAAAPIPPPGHSLEEMYLQRGILAFLLGGHMQAVKKHARKLPQKETSGPLCLLQAVEITTQRLP